MTHYRAIQLILTTLFMFTVSGCATIGNISSTIAQPSTNKIIAAVDRCFQGSKADRETVVRLYSTGKGEWRSFSENGFDYDYYDKDGEWYCDRIKFTAGLNRIAEAQQLLAKQLSQSGKRVLLFNMENGPDVVGYIWMPDYNLALTFEYYEDVRWGVYKSKINFNSIKYTAQNYKRDSHNSGYNRNIDKFPATDDYPILSKEWYQEIPETFKNLVERTSRRNEGEARYWRKEAAMFRLSAADFSGALANASSRNIFTLQSPYGNNTNFVPTYVGETNTTSPVKSGESGKVTPQAATNSGTSGSNNSSYTNSGGSGVKTPNTAYGTSNSSGSTSINSGTSNVKAAGSGSSSSSTSGSNNNTGGSGISFTAIKNENPKSQPQPAKEWINYYDNSEDIKRQKEAYENKMNSLPPKCLDKTKGCAMTQ